jgi:hypothetical protein
VCSIFCVPFLPRFVPSVGGIAQLYVQPSHCRGCSGCVCVHVGC